MKKKVQYFQKSTMWQHCLCINLQTITPLLICYLYTTSFSYTLIPLLMHYLTTILAPTYQLTITPLLMCYLHIH